MAQSIAAACGATVVLSDTDDTATSPVPTRPGATVGPLPAPLTSPSAGREAAMATMLRDTQAAMQAATALQLGELSRQMDEQAQTFAE
jgi:hypothetical protein